MDLLHKLKAVLGVYQQKLIAPTIAIPIHSEEKTVIHLNLKQWFHIVIKPPRTEQIVELPACYEKSVGILE